MNTGMMQRLEPPPPPRASRRRVLLAEDDDDFREYLAHMLRRHGYGVTAVSDGAELVAELRLDTDGCGVHFDVVVTDVQMPGVTGLSVLEGLSWLGESTHVVVISAFADAALVDEARRRGAAAVLSKPFGLEALLSAVARAAAV